MKVGYLENCDQIISGWKEVSESRNIKTRHIKFGHIYPLMNDWFGWKYNLVVEFSEEANETAA
jgi:hypothetical protein